MKDFTELLAWKRSVDLLVEVSTRMRNFPADERFRLQNQLMRSAQSIPSNIAEGFGRYHFGDRLRFYSFAQASLSELKSHVELSKALGYLSEQDCILIEQLMNETGRLTSGLVRATIKLKSRYS